MTLDPQSLGNLMMMMMCTISDDNDDDVDYKCRAHGLGSGTKFITMLSLQQMTLLACCWRGVWPCNPCNDTW